MSADYALMMGKECPYDDRTPVSWDYLAAVAVISELRSRKGLDVCFDDIDSDVREEIVDSLAAVIRGALGKHSGGKL